MKIAFINTYQDQVYRGAETYVRELSSALSDKHEVDVFSAKKLPPKRWPIIWKLFIDPQGLFILIHTISLIPKILKKKYDVVIPTNGGWQPAVVRILTWLYGGKMVIAGLSGVGWDDRNNLWSFPNAFVAISKKACKWAKKANPFVKSYYISGGVNIGKFKPEGLVFKHNLKKPVVLCVAAFTASKRIGLLIRAISKLDNVSLLLEGHGELEEEIKKLGETLLKKRFKLVNYSYDKLPNLYRSADLFSIPSEASHSFELVLVEAMASGLPVVANNDPIRKEIVGDAGILIDPTNINKYVKTIKKALKTDWDNKPRKQAKKFSWDIIVKKYEALFENLV